MSIINEMERAIHSKRERKRLGVGGGGVKRGKE